MSRSTAKQTMWAVYYVGAPYGLDESGHIVSRHRTREAAEAARRKLQSDPHYYGSNSIVRRIEDA